jgi:threonine/homoserine/homoserine lactone efflux protein
VLDQAIGNILPAAVAVALSPIPIVAIVLVLDSTRARSSGPAFAIGWVAGLSVVSVLVVVVAGTISDPGSDEASGINWVMAGIGALFLVMAAQQWKKRPKPGQTTEMPGWMASMNAVSPMRALLMGAALSAVNPKNLALTLAASAAIATADLSDSDTALAIITFVAIGSATVVGAVVFYVAAPRKAERPLAAIREFMAENNATIMMVILLVLGVKILGDALAGVWS